MVSQDIVIWDSDEVKQNQMCTAALLEIIYCDLLIFFKANNPN